jgi:hypothetical protein
MVLLLHLEQTSRQVIPVEAFPLIAQIRRVLLFGHFGPSSRLDAPHPVLFIADLIIFLAKLLFCGVF